MRNFVCKTNMIPWFANLTEANPCFALVDGREATVSLPPRSRDSNTSENQLNPINDKDVAELHDRAATDE